MKLQWLFLGIDEMSDSEEESEEENKNEEDGKEEEEEEDGKKTPVQVEKKKKKGKGRLALDFFFVCERVSYVYWILGIPLKKRRINYQFI